MGGSAQKPEDSGNTTKRPSTDAAGTADLGINQDASPMSGTREGVAPAVARVARSSGNDFDEPLRSPSQLLIDVQAGNQISTAAPRNKEAEKFDLTEWLPGWLPSLLAVTGFSVLLLTAIAVLFIHSGAAALAWRRRGGRAAPDHAVATVVVST